LEFEDSEARVLSAAPSAEGAAPVVLLHGMGDFAANPMGMVRIKERIAAEANAYVHSVELCSHPEQLSGCASEDQSNGFLMTMDGQVDQFARVVRGDPKLAKGFNAVGLSQGNTVIRGYIHRYNDPPVKSFVSMHGVMMGVASIPQCPLTVPVLNLLCRAIDGIVDLGVYWPFVQNSLAQANYFRNSLNLDRYRKSGHFLPYINNEVQGKQNTTYTKNFEALEKLVLVMASGDTMVHPKESEHFGFFKDGSLSELVAMKDAAWYKENWFGLRTLDAAGKIDTYSTPGNHLQFGLKFLLQMVRQYFAAKDTTIQV
jgi:palmitoyl-protein thioesterase